MNTDKAVTKKKETKVKSLGQQIIDAWNSRADEIILPFYAHDYVVEDITAGRIRERMGRNAAMDQKVYSPPSLIFITT